MKSSSATTTTVFETTVNTALVRFAQTARDTLASWHGGDTTRSESIAALQVCVGELVPRVEVDLTADVADAITGAAGVSLAIASRIDDADRDGRYDTKMIRHGRRDLKDYCHSTLFVATHRDMRIRLSVLASNLRSVASQLGTLDTDDGFECPVSDLMLCTASALTVLELARVEAA